MAVRKVDVTHTFDVRKYLDQMEGVSRQTYAKPITLRRRDPAITCLAALLQRSYFLGTLSARLAAEGKPVPALDIWFSDKFEDYPLHADIREWQQVAERFIEWVKE